MFLLIDEPHAAAALAAGTGTWMVDGGSRGKGTLCA